MHDFVDAALGFPVAVFSVLLVIVVAYWLLIALGVLDTIVGIVAAAAVSLFVALAWFTGLVAAVLLHRHHVNGPAAYGGVLVAALALSGLITRLLMRPLRHMVPDEQVPSRQDFVGRMCVIRTGRVDLTFGQAEVRAADGSAAVIQVRQQRNQPAEEPLVIGSTALIIDYDADGEFFWVMPYDAELDPHRPPR